MIKSARFEIERRQNLSYEEFAHEYLCPPKPVIITDVMQQWSVLGRWSPEFFREQFGQLKFAHYGADYSGTGGTFLALHYDAYGVHAFLMQIYGRKEYINFAPEQERFLYPMPERKNLSPINVSKSDFENFPLFQDAAATTFDPEPGEMSFMPRHWWHTVRILTPSITRAANVLNQSNWHELIKFMAQKLPNLVAILRTSGISHGGRGLACLA